MNQPNETQEQQQPQERPARSDEDVVLLELDDDNLDRPFQPKEQPK